jgi:hypothetical protein
MWKTRKPRRASSIAIEVCDVADSDAGREPSVVIIGGSAADSMAIAVATGSNQRRGHYNLLGRGGGVAGGESKRGQRVMESDVGWNRVRWTQTWRQTRGREGVCVDSMMAMHMLILDSPYIYI